MAVFWGFSAYFVAISTALRTSVGASPSSSARHCYLLGYPARHDTDCKARRIPDQGRRGAFCSVSAAAGMLRRGKITYRLRDPHIEDARANLGDETDLDQGYREVSWPDCRFPTDADLAETGAAAVAFGDRRWRLPPRRASRDPLRRRDPNRSAMPTHSRCRRVFACPGGDCGASHSDDTTKCYPLKVEIHRPRERALAGWESPAPNKYSRSHGTR